MADKTSATSATRVRVVLARIIWALFAICALFLGVGALCVALDANPNNGLVKFVLDVADAVDLGVFSRDNGIKEFGGANADTKNALFNWGLGAIAWLVVGRVLERIVRP